MITNYGINERMNIMMWRVCVCIVHHTCGFALFEFVKMYYVHGGPKFRCVRIGNNEIM